MQACHHPSICKKHTICEVKWGEAQESEVQLHFENIHGMGCMCLAKQRVRFLPLQLLSELPVMCITVWFNAYLIIKVFIFSSCYLCGEAFWVEKIFCFYFPNIRVPMYQPAWHFMPFFFDSWKFIYCFPILMFHIKF